MTVSAVIRLRGAQLRNGIPLGKSKKLTSSPVCSNRSRSTHSPLQSGYRCPAPNTKAVGGFKLTIYLHILLRLSKRKAILHSTVSFHGLYKDKFTFAVILLRDQRHFSAK
jgi:hypothetical protein